nr:insulin growth factor-like family member 1 isoform X1 [Oryctolagus cuniculus]XP_051693385.1 insulin growth factor-like family member 1 isoform X2 [Oryctolagus cuniculus]
MSPRCCTLAVSAALCLLMVLCSQGAPVSPTGARQIVCELYGRCGDEFYDPAHYCCHDQAVVPLARTHGCGNCTYRVCFEQCCPLSLTVKLRDQDCSAAAGPGDRLCHSIRSRVS